MSELQAARSASVWVMGLHTGGCSACAQSVAALEAPRYAQRLRALGVTFARMSRQSDILLLSGALTAQALASVSALVEGAPRPCALVAVGDCAIDGCVFAGSAQLTRPLAQALDVNVEIGGCPPTPQAIIEAIAEAQRLLSGKGSAPAAPAPDTEAPALASAAPTSETPGEMSAPDRATRLSSLFEAAGGDWDDEEDDSEQTDTIESDHLTGPRPGASRRASRQSEEKRSE